MSDEDERQPSSSSSSQYDNDHRRRLSEIKLELQSLMREKKKYDVEKLTQDGEFLQSEINDLSSAINEINKEINKQTMTKKKLHIQITNLRSRSQLRYTNLAIALRDKRRFEVELKKENKTEEYRDLARRQIRNIEAALPILREEDEFKERMKAAEEAQQIATTKRKKFEENLNRNLFKQTEIKRLLNENTEKKPLIEERIHTLRAERESLTSTNGKKARRRSSSNCQKPTNDVLNSTRSLGSLEEDSLEKEKQQSLDRLNQVKTLIHYFQEKMREHGLSSTPSSTEISSPLYPPLTVDDQKAILSSYMHEPESDQFVLRKQLSTDSSNAIAMKLPRNLIPLKFESVMTNEIIHSPSCDETIFEYKKELSSDILNKYGGKIKPTSNHKKHQRKQKKHFAISHSSPMLSLYNAVRSSCESSDTLPSIPLFEYDLLPTIKALESFQQSLEFYAQELSNRQNDEQNRSVVENEDSALDTFSDTSSFVDPTPIKDELTLQIPDAMKIVDLDSSEDKKTVTSSASDHTDLPVTIDRQISDEGYRSVRHSAPVRCIVKRSKSVDCEEKVGRWLSNSSFSSSVPFFPRQ